MLAKWGIGWAKGRASVSGSEQRRKRFADIIVELNSHVPFCFREGKGKKKKEEEERLHHKH